MYTATLPSDVHHPNIIKDELVARDWYARKPHRHLLTNIQWCQEVGTPLEFTDDALRNGLCDQHVTQQRHMHCATCRKGFNGYSGCRLCKPSGYSTGTKPVVLSAKETTCEKKTLDNRNAPVEPVIQNVQEAFAGIEIDNNNLTRNPLEKDAVDKKLVVWELNRPEVTQPLPDIDNSAKQSQELKGKQIQALYSLLLEAEGGSDLYAATAVDGNQDPLSKEMKHILEVKEAASVDRFYKEVRRRIPEANGMVTESSPILSKVAGCHNAAMLLGSMEQGKSALFYIANYIAKSKVAFEQCFTVLEKVIEHNEKYPSTAPDSGTQERKTKHVLQRTLNQLNLLMEISDYQAAAALIGLPTEITTDIFSYFTPSAAISMNDFDFVRDQAQKDALDGLKRYVQHHEALEEETRIEKLEENGLISDEDEDLDASDVDGEEQYDSDDTIETGLQESTQWWRPGGSENDGILSPGVEKDTVSECNSEGTPYTLSPLPISPWLENDESDSDTTAYFSDGDSINLECDSESTPYDLSSTEMNVSV